MISVVFMPTGACWEGGEGGEGECFHPLVRSYPWVCSFRAVEHVLVPCHFPYRHDDLGVGTVPRVHSDRSKPHPLPAGSVVSKGLTENNETRGG